MTGTSARTDGGTSVIVSGARTPMGRLLGSLKSFSGADLGGFAIKAALERAGIRLLVEPVNRFDIPGFWLDRADQAAALMDEVGSGNLSLQYDFYHQQRTDGELLATFRRLKGRIAHVQIADNPGRNEPGTGSLPLERQLADLEHAGYTGWVGLEYKPSGASADSFGWLPRERRAAR